MTDMYFGYQDEEITDANKYDVNFTVSKIGGDPEWPFVDKTAALKNPQCKLCGLRQLLVVQIYAPLEHSTYHRTLYIFACINSSCRNQSKSWTCLRSQTVNHDANVNSSISPSRKEKLSPVKMNLTATAWSASAGDWGDDDIDNGNDASMSMTDNQRSPIDDEDDSDSLPSCFQELTVDNNNDFGAQGEAIGFTPNSPVFSAEIEMEDNDLVSVETPIKPFANLVALLESPPIPETTIESINLHFQSSFIDFADNQAKEDGSMMQHVQKILHDYQKNQIEDEGKIKGMGSGNDGSGNDIYEKSRPLHGDKFFHNFVCAIKMDPQQIVRYCRRNKSMVLAQPLKEPVSNCPYCGDKTIFELQLLPTLIPKLTLSLREDDSKSSKFGCALEFGNVLIFTCERSCWTSGDVIKEEMVVVQGETFS